MSERTLTHGQTTWAARTWAVAAALGLGACAQTPAVVGDDCGDDDCGTSTAQLTRIEAVDVLMVIDSSASIAGKAEQLKAELPRMMNAMLTGEDGDTSFPPAKSVHVAVTTSDMGIGVGGVPQCNGVGDDGVFLAPGEVGVTCDDTSFPGYLAYDGGPASLATADSVSCVPLVGYEGCGFEQHLEAGLKALWPSTDERVTFREGQGHGDRLNNGFLREDSLLVVIVVTDEDDCSAADSSLFTPPTQLDPDDPLIGVDLNLRCYELPDRLHNVDRYVEGFRSLRADNDNVIFAVIAGIPADLVDPDTVDDYDLTTPQGADNYFDRVLSDSRMQYEVDESAGEGRHTPVASCEGGPDDGRSLPPRRLVETAAGFGTEGVLGSLCADDFGATVGHIIRTAGERLTEAANAGNDDDDA